MSKIRPYGPAHAPARSALRVLIVEDHPIIALAVQTTLEALGHDVVGTAKACAEVCPHDPSGLDFALVDINLADGATGSAIAEHLSSGGVTVVFHTSDPGRIPADFAHAVGVLEKPSTSAALANVVAYVSHGGFAAETPVALQRLKGSG